jgi:hypothetical protein
MVVKCVKTSINRDNPNVINNNMEEYLKLGADYYVYGIRVSEDANYFMIFDDGHLVEVPVQMFQIIQGKGSPFWIIRKDATKGLTIWPELFYEKDFFENFSEWEELERNQFDELRRLFEESPDNPNQR